MQFKVGDQAVYPGHGLGKITSIETKEISGAKQTFYSIMLTGSDMKIMIPENRMKKAGIRTVITKDRARQVLKILKDKDAKHHIIDSGKNWSKRYQEYMKIIKTGSIIKIACILRELLNIDEKKGLSFYERQLLLTISRLLFDEMAAVVKKEELHKVLDFSRLLENYKQ